MKKTRYEQAVDSIHAPGEAVQRLLRLAEEEPKEKIIPMKNNKQKTIKRTVIAASLALVMTLAAVFGINALSPKNSPFVISVNAAELSKKDYAVIGTMNAVGGDFEENEKGSITLTEDFDFRIRVEGENVRSVKYYVVNGGFGTTGKFTEFTDDDVSRAMQDEEGKNYVCLSVSATSSDLTLPAEVRQAVRDLYDHANTKLGQPVSEGYDDSTFRISECKKTIYTALLDRLVVEVLIVFDDGSVEIRALRFACDNVTEDGVATVGAKLV